MTQDHDPVGANRISTENIIACADGCDARCILDTCLPVLTYECPTGQRNHEATTLAGSAHSRTRVNTTRGNGALHVQCRLTHTERASAATQNTAGRKRIRAARGQRVLAIGSQQRSLLQLRSRRRDR